MSDFNDFRDSAFGQRVTLYGLAGFTSVNQTNTYDDSGAAYNSNLGEASFDEIDMNYGDGVEVDVTEHVSGYAEWVSYFDRSYQLNGNTEQYSLEVASVGMTYSW